MENAVATAEVKQKSKKMKRLTELQRRRRAGFLFVLPFLIGFICFYFQPLLTSIDYTFRSVQPKPDGLYAPWVGLQNYEQLFSKDATYLPALWTCFKDMLINTPVIIIFSLFIAVIINQKFRGRMFARAIFFMPVVISSGLVMGIMNGDVLMQDVQSDTSSAIFTATGMVEILEGMNLPEEVIGIFVSIVGQIFDTLWKCGIQILLFLASLQSVSPSLYEAAKIEGASGWETFWKVTFPNVTPIILVNVIYTIIDTITDSSNSLMSSIESAAYSSFNYSKACAMAWIFFIGLLLFIGLIFLIFNRFVIDDQTKK
jgi:ABC-type sugar transport system permease subunit